MSLVVSGTALPAQTIDSVAATKPVLDAVRVTHAPRIDGRLDEVEWKTAPVATTMSTQSLLIAWPGESHVIEIPSAEMNMRWKRWMLSMAVACLPALADAQRTLVPGQAELPAERRRVKADTIPLLERPRSGRERLFAVLQRTISLHVEDGSAILGEASDVDSLRRRALRITALEFRRQEVGATSATVDSLLALYSDSVSYEHPNAGAIVRGKAALRRGMLEYLGSIRAVAFTEPRVTLGPHVAVVETNVHMEIRDGDTWKATTRKGLRVIEFDLARRVRRLIDFPW